jgi:6-pyruvoyl-tetrahydropterin synthase
MIAHSFSGETFGPAQALHGATYVVDAEFFRGQLDADGVVIDIARATEVLKAILGRYNLQNLDAVPAFAEINTTTEYLAGHIAEALAGAIGNGDLDRLRVTLNESHVASASYEMTLGG